MSSLIVPGQTAPKKPSYKSYDDEFHWADEKDPVLAAEITEFEGREKHVGTGSDTKEKFHQLYEQNRDARKEHKFADQDELKTKREGRILHMNEFMYRLRSAGLNAWYTSKGGMARTLGLFVSHTGLKTGCQHENGAPHYVGFVQVPFMQEFEELHFDRYDVPLGSKRRGWRTILLKLIEQEILTEKQAHEVFGEPLGSIVSRRYLSYLKFLRNRNN